MKLVLLAAASVSAAVSALLLFAGTAAADPATFTVGSSKLTVTKTTEGQSASASITNLTTAPVTVSLAPATPDGGCSITAAPTQIAAATSVSVSFTFPATCSIPATGRDLLLRVGDAQAPIPAILDTALPLAWAELVWFLWALVGGVVLMMATFRHWAWCGYDDVKGVKDGEPSATDEEVTPPAAPAASPSPKGVDRPLPGLPNTWSFKDSWASVITLVTALFSGLFGASEVLKAIVGGADTTTPLATISVAGAIALGLVGLSTLLLQGLRTRAGENTVIGLLVASVVTLCATGGQLGVIVSVALNFTFPPVVHWGLLVAGIVAAIVLALYACRSTLYNLRFGKVSASTPPAAPTVLIKIDGDTATPQIHPVPDLPGAAHSSPAGLDYSRAALL